jgi:DNA gyrase subunit A
LKEENTKSKDSILEVSIEEEMERAYLNYSMSVITSRALPDCRDGLKPVHRRILYAMHSTGNYCDKPYRKSARVVGEVMGLYHPHGDSAIYSSLVRMAQPFSLLVPLIDGQGNFGSVDGDSPAQMRYTEVKMSKAANYILEDIDKDTVDFQDNYDGSEREPKVLPSKFPNLLVNGANGIAVGMATSIPTHNLNEIIDAVCALIKNPKISDKELLEIIPAPDFPTGAKIINAINSKKAMISGRGSIILRSISIIEEKLTKKTIVITEIPYQVNKSDILKSIEHLIKDKTIEGIAEIRDETNKLGIRIAIDLKKEAKASIILNQLYQNTQLQSTFSVNMLALNNGSPELMGIRKILNLFISFRIEIVKKKVAFLLLKARKRAHHLIGLSIAVTNIDKIISIIKFSTNSTNAKNTLMGHEWSAGNIEILLQLVDDYRNKIRDGKCFFTEEQAKSILEMKLHKLTFIENDKINNELKILSIAIKDYLDILLNNKKIFEIIKKEFLEIKNKITTPRKTIISEISSNINDEDLIPQEDMLITLTKTGFIKTVSLNVYSSQKRGGKGKSAMTVYNDDIITDLLVANTHTPLLFFSERGRVYKLKVYNLPVSTRQSKGRAIVNLLPIDKNDRITRIISMPECNQNCQNMNIVFATKRGRARRNSLSDFTNIQCNGKIAMKLKDNDALIGIDFCSDYNHVLLATRLGKAIRFSINALRVFKSRSSGGVKAVKLAHKNDEVISMSILKSVELDVLKRDKYLKIPLKQRMKLANEFSDQKTNPMSNIQLNNIAKNEQLILTITANGYGKRTSGYEYRVTNRNSHGVLNIDTGQRNGLVVSSFFVENNDHIMLMTNSGTIIRTEVKSIRVTSRNAKGVKIINLNKNEKVVSVSKVCITDEKE